MLSPLSVIVVWLLCIECHDMNAPYTAVLYAVCSSPLQLLQAELLLNSFDRIDLL